MRIFIGILLCALSVTGYVDTVSGQIRKPALEQSTLWKIEKPNYKTSYLLGTMHVSDPRVTNFPAEINSVINSADELIVEVSMDASAKEQVMRTMMLQPNDSLANYLEPEKLSQVLAYFNNQPMLKQQVLRMKPWAVMVFLSLPKEFQGLPMDTLIQKKFLNAGKPVGQLESVIEQLGVFDQLAVKDQVSMLNETIQYLPKMDSLMARMYELYLQGDLDGLLALSNEYLQTADNKILHDLMFELIDIRNARMAERVASYLDKGNVLISIGALHLPGESGLISLLEQSGYRLTPIPLTR